MSTRRGFMKIKGLTLECLDSSKTRRWSFHMDSIVLVAEYTTNEGPYVDDYFLVFATVEDGKLYFSTCSFYSAGREEALSGLQKHLGSPIDLELQGSTEWRSRVAWPAKMVGKEYFSFTEVPTTTLTEKLKKRLLGPTQEYAISKAVRQYLEEQLRSHL